MKVNTVGSIAVLALGALAVLAVVVFACVPVEAEYPLLRAKAGLLRGTRTRLRAIVKAQEMVRENRRLKREVASLSLVTYDNVRLMEENDRLRKALDYHARKKDAWLAAAVLSVGGGAVGRAACLRIDRGSLAGIKKGAIAMAPAGLVGLVTAVTPHTAVVTLLTDETVQVACEVESTAVPPMRGILTGGTVEKLNFRYLKNVVPLPPRARVVTSGLGGVFPKGLEVGSLLTVREGSDGIVDGSVQPAVDFDNLEDVFIRCEK